MKLARNSGVIRWAYFMWQDYEIPDRTNVCALFWRVILLTPLQLVAFAGMLLFLWPIPLSEWLKKKGYTDFLHRPIRLPSIKLSGPGVGSLAWQRLKDWKSGVCSIVEIE